MKIFQRIYNIGLLKHNNDLSFKKILIIAWREALDEIFVYILTVVWDKLRPDVWRNFPIFLFIKTSTFIKCWETYAKSFRPPQTKISKDWLIFRVAKLIVDVLTCMITFLFVPPMKNQSSIQNNINLYNGWTTRKKVWRNQTILITLEQKGEKGNGMCESIYL